MRQADLNKGQLHPESLHLHEILSAIDSDLRHDRLSIARPGARRFDTSIPIRSAHMEEPRGFANWKAACVGYRESLLTRKDKRP
jgi:hypothetical protein